jgi:hypothetical protein
MTRVDNLSLARWREVSAIDVLRALADYVKQDSAFDPHTSKGTTRWHVAAGEREFEFLCTGTKFFDTRAQKGGGGAVDLTMHLFALDFRSAVKLLQERGL